jgi:hypothetical protein
MLASLGVFILGRALRCCIKDKLNEKTKKIILPLAFGMIGFIFILTATTK